MNVEKEVGGRKSGHFVLLVKLAVGRQIAAE